eukprot:6188541-Pleurochrysis_carterae.AAC.2
MKCARSRGWSLVGRLPCTGARALAINSMWWRAGSARAVSLYRLRCATHKGHAQGMGRRDDATLRCATGVGSAPSRAEGLSQGTYPGIRWFS